MLTFYVQFVKAVVLFAFKIFFVVPKRHKFVLLVSRSCYSSQSKMAKSSSDVTGTFNAGAKGSNYASMEVPEFPL